MSECQRGGSMGTGALQGARGRVVAVCSSRLKGEKKTDVGRGRFAVDCGLVGDAHSGDWHRQVSLLGTDSIARMQARGVEVAPGDFAENLTVEGLQLYSLPVGTRLRVGETVVLEVTQIGKECHHGCAIRTQVGDCVMPREGIFARVLAEGWVSANDEIEVMG